MIKFYHDNKEATAYLSKADKTFPGISSVAKGKEIIIASGRYKEIFLVSKELLNMFNRLKDKSRIITIGELFGTVSDTFVPSFSSLSEYAKLSKKKVFVSQKGEQTFLYGFNLEKKFVVSFDTSIKVDDHVVVCNEHDEVLGLGKVISDFEDSKSEQKVIKNILDLGLCLRHKKMSE